MGRCKYCGGTGRQYIESGSSMYYACEDCDGTGYMKECDYCGKEYSGEYCEDCYDACIECGDYVPEEELIGGRCECCHENYEMDYDIQQVSN